MPKRAVLIAGPTASGKSALALARARDRDGIIVNTDALQVYDGLRLLTARPSDEDLAAVPHRLYGVVPPSTRFSTGDWARAAARLIAEAEDRALVFVGGTGLYFEALTQGFAEVPEIAPEAVAWAEAQIEGLNREERAEVMARHDPVIAARLKAPDPQRVVRALAVMKGTGRSLATFQDAAQEPLLAGFEIEKMILDPGREVSRERIAMRFVSMLDYGAIEEVRGLNLLQLDPSLPVTKAIGVREISEFIAGTIGRDEMIERAVIATRQYAKRQRTWFRNRMADWPRVS